MRVHIAYVAPDTELYVALDLAEGATVDDAVRASRITERIGVTSGAGACAIFGRRVAGDTPLCEGDRVEITRPLACDPKLARRNRAARSAGDAAANPAKPPGNRR